MYMYVRAIYTIVQTSLEGGRGNALSQLSVTGWSVIASYFVP